MMRKVVVEEKHYVRTVNLPFAYFVPLKGFYVLCVLSLSKRKSLRSNVAHLDANS